MSYKQVGNPYSFFTDTDGKPLESGYIYVGSPGLDAEFNQVSIYSDSALTVPLSQPIRTSGGYPVISGGVIDFYVDGDYSIKVKNKNSELVYTKKNNNVAISGELLATFDNLADAKAADFLINGCTVITRRYHAGGSGGGNEFVYDSSSVATANNGSIVALNTLPGRLLQRNTERSHVKQFGAKGDGTTDDLQAIQACIDAKFRLVDFVSGEEPASGSTPTNKYVISNTIDLANAAAGLTLNGMVNETNDGRASKIIYSATGPETATSAMFKITDISTGYGIRVNGLVLDLNNRAKHGFMFVSGSSFQAIKNMQFNNCYCLNIPVGGVGWRINDQSNTLGLGANDMDAWNYSFINCHARSSFAATQTTGATGWIVDATNAYNISWRDCSDGQSGSGGMLCGIQTIRGSGFRVYNYFSSGGKTGATSIGAAQSNKVWAINHKAGSMEIYGINTEDFRLIRADTNGEADSMLSIYGAQVNDSDATNGPAVDYVVYSTVNTILNNCNFTHAGSGLVNKKVYCSADLTADKVNLGAEGKYELSKPWRCDLESVAVGSLELLNANACMHWWRGTASNDLPFGWEKTTLGNAVFTVQQDSANNYIGRYTANINVTTANSSTSDITGIQVSGGTEMSIYRGRKLYAFAIVTGDTTKAGLEIDFLPTGATFLTSAYDTKYTDGTDMRVLYGILDLTAVTGALTTLGLKVGINPSQTGSLYVDAAGFCTKDFEQYIPALGVHAQFINQYGTREVVGSGLLPFGTGGSRTIELGAAAPTAGDYLAGSIVIDSTPSAGGKIGWVCVTAGTPGTWKPWGAIDP